MTFNARSLLGWELADQKLFAAAEPLLLESYAGLIQRAQRVPANSRVYLREEGERLIQICEA